MSQINLKAYQEFVKDMRDRLNPDNYYSEAEATEAPVTDRHLAAGGTARSDLHRGTPHRD